MLIRELEVGGNAEVREEVKRPWEIMGLEEGGSKK